MNFISLRSALLTAALALMSPATPATATTFPGPDGFGYSGANIAFNLRDISATGASVFSTFVDDTVSGPIAIGFGFSFYGTTYTNVFVGSNGFITFSAGQSHGCCNGGPLPGTADPSNMVAGWFTDLVSNSGQIRTQTIGAAGSREFIVEYINNPYFGNGNSTNTFEIILRETTNDIELQYEHTGVDGHNRSVGIENLGGTIGLQVLNDTTSLLNSQGICISTGSTTCPTATRVPEPATLSLLGAGVFALALARRRRRD